MKLYEDFIADIEGVATKEELINKVTGEFDDYPHIQQGLKSYIDQLFTKDVILDEEDTKQQLIDLLNEINNFSENELEALDMEVDDQGPWYFEDATDIINRGDYIYFPGVESDEDLGHAYVDMIGSVVDAVGKNRLVDFIDIDAVADSMWEEEGLEPEDYYDLTLEYVEADPEGFVDDYFDYEAFGRELRISDGYFIGDTGALWIN